MAAGNVFRGGEVVADTNKHINRLIIRNEASLSLIPPRRVLCLAR